MDDSGQGQPSRNSAFVNSAFVNSASVLVERHIQNSLNSTSDFQVELPIGYVVRTAGGLPASV
jgi:hypothetical protein